MNLYILREFDKEIYIKLSLSPYNSIGTTFELEETYSYEAVNSFIGVKKIEIEDLKTGEKLKYLINVSLEQNMSKPINKYRKEILELYGNYRPALKKQDLLNELKYYNFETEFNMVLCSYLLIKEGKSIFDINSRSFRLYIHKLYYIGIDINDYHNNYEKFNRKTISEQYSKEEIISYFLRYICFLAYFAGDRNIERIEEMTYLICERYISLTT